MGLAETADLAVRISLDDKLSGGLAKMSGKLKGLDGSMSRIGKSVGRLGGGLAKAGLIAGGAAVAGLAASAKAAIDFQEAFQGVVKTVDEADLKSAGLTFEDLSDSIRKMAREMPISANALAGIAEQAGALGIKGKDIEAFTRQVAILASTTDVSAEDAASSLGALVNVIGLAGDEFDNFSAALVDLGNKGSSTESQILEITNRSGQAAKLFGLAKDQTLAWSAAAANLNINQELAGTALQKLYLTLLPTATKKSKAFAAVMGISGKAVVKTFKKDGSAALELFIKKLSKMDAESRLAAVQDIFGKGSGITRLVLGLADSYDKNLAPAIDTATKAWKEGTAAQEEFEKRNATVRSAITRLKNNVIDAAISIGEGMVPALGRAADKLSKFLDTNRQDFKDIGRDIGSAIDRIDIDKLTGAAKNLAKSLGPALQLLLSIAEQIGKLPPEVLGAGAGLIVTDRATGGAISGGIGGIIGGLGASLTKNLVASVPLFGAAFVQPVRVVNWGGMPGGTPGGGVPGGGAGLREVAGAAGAAAIGVAVAQGLKEAGGAIGDAIFGSGSAGAQALDQWGEQARQAFGPLETIRMVLAGELPGKFDTMINQLKALTGNAGDSPKPASTNWSNLGDILNRGNLGQVPKVLAQQEQQTRSSIATLRERLHNALRAEHRADRAGNQQAANRASAKADAIRGKLDAANAKLAQIRAKKTQFKIITNVTTTTSVSVSELKKANIYRQRTTRGNISQAW